MLTLEAEGESVTSELFFTEYKRCEIAKAAVRVEVTAGTGDRGITVALVPGAPRAICTLVDSRTMTEVFTRRTLERYPVRPADHTSL